MTQDMGSKMIVADNIFPRWEQNIPTLGTKHSQAGNKTGLRLVLDDISLTAGQSVAMQTSRASRHFSDRKGTECGFANVSCLTTLRLVVTLFLMLVLGVPDAWATDYYYFIVNKSGKIVTYGKTTNQKSNTVANETAIPAQIKSVNAKNWKLYNGDQLATTPAIVIPQKDKPTETNYVIDCASWGDVTLVANPTEMGTLADCESGKLTNSDYSNYIFVFYDYDENSKPDVRNGTFYTLQYHGNGTPATSSYAYYNTTDEKVANTGKTATPSVNNTYYWCFKAKTINGEVDPYDVKVYNASVGTGAMDHFVASPLLSHVDPDDKNGVGSGPENDYNKLQPASEQSSPSITSYYIVNSYESGYYNISGKPAYNCKTSDSQSRVLYKVWAQYQLNGSNQNNFEKSGITSQLNFIYSASNNATRRYWASIKLTPLTYTYKIVDANGNIIVQATTEDNALEVPNVIKSPLATYRYYSDAAGEHELTGSTAGSTTTIYVRYTTRDDVLNLKGEIKYNISVGGTNYLYAADETTLSSEATSENNANNNHKWKLNSNDAYQITIKNVDNEKGITYDVSSGETAPTLSATGSKFFLHQSTSGQYEVVAIASNDYSTTDYYTLGMASSTLKLYSSSNYPLGNAAVQTIFTPRATAAITTPPAANSLTYNGSNQGLVTFGTASNGTMKYRLGDTGSYEETIPTAKDANTYNVYYMAAGDDGYEDFIAAEPIVVTINPKALTITAGSASKTYNGTALTEASFNATALEEGDTHTFTIVMTEGSTITNVGTQANVIATVDGVAVTTGTETAVGNYLVTTADGTLTINPKAVTITAGSASETYNGTALTESGFTASALEEGDTHSFTVVMTEESTITDVGTKDNEIATVDGVAVTTGTETAVGNYKVTTAKGTLTVNQKEVGLDWSNTNLTYNGTAQAPTATATGVVNGDEISVTVTGTQTNVGTGYTATASGLTGTKAGNYKLPAENTTTFKISAKTLTITAEAKSKTYGDADPELTYTSEGLVEGDLITGALSRAEGEIVGTYAINQSTLTAGDNYVISYTGANLTITQKALTITADSDTKEYDGEPLTKNSYTHTDLVSGDVITSVTITGSQTDRGSSYNVPSAALIKNNNGEGGDVTGCYDITYVNGTLSVTGRPITITAGSDSKVYDGTELTKNSYTVDGTLFSGDAISSVTVTGSQTVVGSSDNVPSDVLIKNNGEGADVTANYTVTYVKGTLTVTRAAATVTADDQTKAYGDADPTFTWTATGLKGSDTKDVLTVSTSRADGQDIGEYTITPTGNAEQGNYNVTYATGKLTITRATATVTANDMTKVYGDSDPEYTATVSGLKYEDTASAITYTVSRTQSGENTGNYTILPSGDAVQGNYNVNYQSGKLTINPKNIGDGVNIDITKSGDDYQVTVTQGDKTLEIGDTKDYTWTGTGTDTYVVTVTGHGNYTGEAQATFINLDFFDTTPNATTQTEETAAAYKATQDLQATNGVEAYYVTNVDLDNRIVEIAKVGEAESKPNYIPNGLPVLLLGDADTEGFTLKPYTGSETVTITDNILQVSDGSVDVTTPDYYIFYQGEFVLSMWGTGKQIKVGKFFVHPDGSSSTPAPAYGALRVVKRGETTKIDEIVENSQLSTLNSQLVDEWYTLDGQKLNKKPTRKGIYIQNGKKQIVK